ncbi:putative G-protein coupled receptor [Dirofilaria immitis]
MFNLSLNPSIADRFSIKMISGQDPNDTECICSDLQHDDYSPSYEWFNYIAVIILLPSLSTFGVASNVVNIFVYSAGRMRSSSNTYLLFLACSDCLVVITGLFIFWIDSARTYIPELSRAPYTTVYALPIGYMAQTCSICWKTLSASYCTVRRACEINTCITICSVIYNSLRFPQFNLRKCLHNSSKEIMVEICPTPLFFAINTIYNVYMYMVLMTLLPFLFLSILNAIIVVQQSSLSRSNSMGFVKNNASRIDMTASLGHLKSTMLQPHDRKMLGKNNGMIGSDDSITMIMVVILFLCCNILALIVNVIETFFEPSTLLLNFLTDISNFLVVLNSSINCLIYYTFNKEYKKVFLLKMQTIKRLLTGKCSKPNVDQKQGTLSNFPTFFAKIFKKNASKREIAKCASPVWQPMYHQIRNYNSFPITNIDSVDNPMRFRIQKIFTNSKFTLIYPFTCTSVINTSYLKVSLDGYRRNAKSDNGWRNTASVKDSTSSKADIKRKHWIAEIQIEHRNESDTSQPRIYVFPLRKYIARNISITTL